MEKDKKLVGSRYQIFFASDSAAVEQAPHQSVVIYPLHGKNKLHPWNDFGLKTQYMFTVIDRYKPVLSSSLRFAFLDIKDDPRTEGTHTFYDAYTLLDALIESGQKLVSEAKLPHFFTMLPSMQAYREVVLDMGKVEAQSVLIALRDMVAIKEFKKTAAWYPLAIKSKAFNLSFVREHDAFYAYCNAGSILRGIDKEELGRISEEIHFGFRLPIFDNDHKFQFSFRKHKVIPTNIAILIGKNGVGKSQTLNKLVKAALNGDTKSFSAQDGSKVLLNRILAIAAPGETNNTFPLENKNGRIPYKNIYLGRNIKKKHAAGIGDLLVQLLRSTEYVAGQRRFKIFLATVEKFLPLEEVALKVDTENEPHSFFSKGYVTFNNLGHGGEQVSLETYSRIIKDADPVRIQEGQIFPLSSGQITFLKFIIAICMHIENGTLILLDEPETHLHPNLISELVGILNSMLEYTGSIAIIATHSVYFVREVPRSQVYILKSSSPRSIEVEKPRLKTMGAEIGSISQFVFEDEISSSLIEGFQKQMDEIAPIDAKRKLFEMMEELPSEALIQIAQYLKIKLS